MTNDIRQLLKETISDLVLDLLYYDRRECSRLPRGKIEQLIEEHSISTDDLAMMFRDELNKSI